MCELKQQSMLAESLNFEFERFGMNAKACYGNQFKNIEGKRWGKKPDLIIFHNQIYLHPTKRTKVLKSPIGIEFKKGNKFNQITTGVLNQITKKYAGETYYLNEEKDKPFKLSSLAFATTISCSTGKVYSKYYPEASNFFIERFCWRANVAVLLKHEGEFAFSFVNYLYWLNGDIKARYGEGGVLV